MKNDQTPRSSGDSPSVGHQVNFQSMTPKKDHIELLSRMPLFSGLEHNHLQTLDGIGIERRVRRNESVFSEGDDSEGFYVVLEGEVKVFKVSKEGREKILHLFGPGQPIGEVAVFSGQRFPANAQATVNTRVLFFPRAAFVQLLSSDPVLLLNMLAILSKRLRDFAAQIESLTLKEVPSRLASYLLHLADEQKRDDGVVLHLSKGQLASILGTIPETLSRALSRLATHHAIAVDGRNIRFLDRKKLADAAEGKPYPGGSI